MPARADPLACLPTKCEPRSEPTIRGIQIAVGGYHSCALLANGNAHCWGNNWSGQANDYLGGDAKQLAAGWAHTCALLANGNAHCWGDNGDGQANDYLGGDAKQLTAGGDHTCALLANGNAHCWGDNGSGQANDYLGGDAKQLTAGGFHTCALLANGNAHCWGYNGDGEANDYVPPPPPPETLASETRSVNVTTPNVPVISAGIGGHSTDATHYEVDVSADKAGSHSVTVESGGLITPSFQENVGLVQSQTIATTVSARALAYHNTDQQPCAINVEINLGCVARSPYDPAHPEYLTSNESSENAIEIDLTAAGKSEVVYVPFAGQVVTVLPGTPTLP